MNEEDEATDEGHAVAPLEGGGWFFDAFEVDCLEGDLYGSVGIVSEIGVLGVPLDQGPVTRDVLRRVALKLHFKVNLLIKFNARKCANQI